LFRKNRPAAAEAADADTDAAGDTALITDERIEDERDRDDSIESVAPDPVDRLEPARHVEPDERVERVDEVEADYESDDEPVDAATVTDEQSDESEDERLVTDDDFAATVPPPPPPEPIPQPGPDPVPEPAPQPGPGPDPAPEPIPPPGPGPDPVPDPVPLPEPDPMPSPGPLTRTEAEDGAEPAEVDAGEVVAIDLRDAPTAVYDTPQLVTDQPPPTVVTEGGPLLPDAGVWEQRFTDVQVAFVDDPGLAIHQADGLVTEAMEELAKILLAHREALQAQWREPEAPDTEHLRLTFQGYRALLFGILSA
jgi:hypothetical protein